MNGVSTDPVFPFRFVKQKMMMYKFYFIIWVLFSVFGYRESSVRRVRLCIITLLRSSPCTIESLRHTLL